jgi:hypothetical protein
LHNSTPIQASGANRPPTWNALQGAEKPGKKD